MQVASFLGFFIIYMQMSLSNAKSKYSVKVMNDMFTYPGWHKWIQLTGNVSIIDHQMNDEKFDVNHLLTPSNNGLIVTNQNVEHKIRQARQFLSCKYTVVLKEFCDYERGIGPVCMRMDIPSKSLDCLGFSIKMLKMADSLVMLIEGSLSCFQQLSPETHFDNQLLEILEYFKNYYRNITFDRDSIATGDAGSVMSTVATQTASVEEEMTNIFTQLSAFFNGSCRPIPYEVVNNQISRHTSRIQNWMKNYGSDRVVDEIKAHIKKMINEFIKVFGGEFGFNYDLESTMTILMYDPDVLRRVKRMNKILERPGWSALDDAEIIMPENRWETINEFLTASADGKIVTKANVDEKVQRAHHFLTCNYALTLKRCCDYMILGWKHYNTSMHLPDSSTHREQFVSMIMTSKPLVSNMQHALSHFYQLSSHIEYNRTVSVILENFENCIENYFESNINEQEKKTTKPLSKTICSTASGSNASGSKIIKKNLDIETDMTNILKSLIEFYVPNCFPFSKIKSNAFLEEYAEVTLSNLETSFKQEIHNLIKKNYNDFGFPFKLVK